MDARVKTALVLVCVCSIIAGGVTLYTHFSGGRSKTSVDTEAYTEEKIKGMESSGVFCTSVLSTKKNGTLERSGYMLLKTKADYDSFLQKYQDIKVTYPETVPVVEDWYAAGYQAVAFSTDAFEPPVNMVASQKFVDDSGDISVIVRAEPINEQFQYNKDVSECKQASVIVYIKEDLLAKAENIHFLVEEGDSFDNRS